MKINNNQGSILIVAMGFVVVFIMLGFATLHYSTVQNELAQKEMASSQAFWMADGGIELAKAKIPDTFNVTPYNYYNANGDAIPETTYALSLQRYQDPVSGYLYNNKWTTEAKGNINLIARKISADIQSYSLDDQPPVQSDHPVDFPDDPPAIPPVGPILEPFDREDISRVFFDDTIGYHNSQLIPVPDYGIKDAQGEEAYFDVVEQDFFIVLAQEGNEEINITINQSSSDEGPLSDDLKFILVDVSLANAGDGTIPPTIPKIRLAGPLHGILFVNGNAIVEGSPIDGALIAKGNLTLTGDLSNITIDAQAIDEIMTSIGAIPGGGSKTVVAWKETNPYADPEYPDAE